MAETNQTQTTNDMPPSDSFGIGGKDIAAGLRALNPVQEPEAAQVEGASVKEEAKPKKVNN